MPRKKLCCVPQCEYVPGTVRHKFPVYEEREFRIWVKRINNPLLKEFDDVKIYKNFMVCDKHFHDNCRSLGTKRLNRLSLPTLYLPGFSDSLDVLGLESGPSNKSTGLEAPPAKEELTNQGANNTGSTTSDIQDTITKDTPINVSELKTNVKDLEFDKLINEPDSPGNVSAGESNLFGCPMCCEKQFSLTDLQQHISRYIWGSLKCPVCDEVCVGLEILAIHLDEHHSDQEMTLSENSLLTNVAKSPVSSEESVNISCGDVRDQVIKHQTDILTDVDKERITVDKSVNHNKNKGGSEKHDMEICVPLKNNITSPCNTFSSKNISNRSKFVKKTDINVSSVKQTSLAYKTRSLRHRPRLSIKNITDLQIPNVSSNSLEKTLKPQSSYKVPIDIMKRYAHNSGITKTSFVPVTNILDNKQRLITYWCENCKNVSTSSQKTETRVGATHCMDSKCEICCQKCGISFISERPCV